MSTSNKVYKINHIEANAEGTAKGVSKRMLGEKGMRTVKKLLGA